MKIPNLKTYLTSPNKCFIPKCKAICCADAPLPIDFLPKHQDKVQRKIFNITNIGHNDPSDTFDSVMFNTTGNPIQLLGVDQNGNKVVGIPTEVMQKMQLKSMEEIKTILEDYNKHPNYCPFITDSARCSVYSQRPQICKEFGTDPRAINKCPEKSSLC